MGVSTKRQILDLLGFTPQAWGVSMDEVDRVAYMEEGIIDSLQMVGLIIDLEECFNIQLTAEDTESDRFRTVGGLVSIVDERIQEGATPADNA